MASELEEQFQILNRSQNFDECLWTAQFFAFLNLNKTQPRRKELCMWLVSGSRKVTVLRVCSALGVPLHAGLTQPPCICVFPVWPPGFINRLLDGQWEEIQNSFYFLGFIWGISFQENLPVPWASSLQVSKSNFSVQPVFHRRMGIQGASWEIQWYGDWTLGSYFKLICTQGLRVNMEGGLVWKVPDGQLQTLLQPTAAEQSSLQGSGGFQRTQ